VWQEPVTYRPIDTSGLLIRFVALSDAGADDVLAFARTYGPLWLCERHSIVSWHRPIMSMSSWLAPTETLRAYEISWINMICLPRIEGSSPQTWSEPFEGWRSLARSVGILLRALHAVHMPGRVIGSAMWQAIEGFELPDEALGPLADDSRRLAENLNAWIQKTDVQLIISATNRRFHAALGSNPYTFSALGLVALELVRVAMNAGGLIECGGCRRLYMPKKPPRAGTQVGKALARRDYCDPCRESRVPQRDAARDARARKRKLKEEGPHGPTTPRST
jgi:hypothetical protein